ncbi:DUF2997 domain-containing protein [Amycolatopsis vancoresmycina]|uniref:DUF2997 domain-containing protein n=1 Tax=Amycolatopsis vancoresmycina DSM 44592 TaxID=1292037 RepID=R1HYQ0_9PSEU|nr:DUF2997 domain-containing protein [Amycolatopsis vancoresmycina]EOD63389.1 hypothetical protein H480_37245 [Amycolatopsis vancoresmycina DSM 44592]
MTHRVTVTIGKDGSISAETHGVTGSKCLDYIPLLEDLLGAETVASEFTEDYRRVAAENTAVQQQSQWNS